MARLTHDEIVKLESELAQGENPTKAIFLSRNRRWAEALEEIPLPAELTAWRTRMIARYGPGVLMFGDPVGWITGLLICRYGQAEYYWPTEFSQGDIRRATEWENGLKPEGCQFLPMNEVMQ